MLSLKFLQKSVTGALLASALLAPAAYAATPVLSFVATPASGIVGSTIDLDIRITDVTDLYSFQFSVEFNSNTLQAGDLYEGKFLLSGGETYFIPGEKDNSAGLVSYMVNTLLGPVGGVSGSGSLAHITFSVFGAGSSTLRFKDVLLLDSAQNDITPTLTEQVVVTSAVPEPASYLMLGAGLLGLAALRRRQA